MLLLINQWVVNTQVVNRFIHLTTVTFLIQSQVMVVNKTSIIIGVTEACKNYYGFCTSVIKRHDDVEDKLVVVPDEAYVKALTDEVIQKETAFIEQYFDISLIRI